MEERSAHTRVRVAMYSVIVLLVVLGVLRGVLSQQWQEDRQLDIEVLESIGEQRVIAQRLAMLVQQLQTAQGGGAHLESLQAVGQRLRDESARLDALVQQ